MWRIIKGRKDQKCDVSKTPKGYLILWVVAVIAVVEGEGAVILLVIVVIL